MNRLQKTVARLLGLKSYSSYPSYGWGGAVTPVTGDIAYTDEGAALAYSVVTAVNRSINLRADNVEAFPWQIVTNTDDPEAAEIICTSETNPKHELAKIIREYRRMDGVPFFKRLMYHRDLYGKVFVELGRERYMGSVKGFRLLNPLVVMPQFLPDGTISQYHYSGGVYGGAPRTIPADDVAYDYLFNPVNDRDGQSPLMAALNAARIDRSLKQHVRDFFNNGAFPGAIVTPTDDMMGLRAEQQETIRRQFQDTFRGRGNAFRAWVAPQKFDVTIPEQPDIGRQYTVYEAITKEIYSAFGVPPMLAGASDTTSYKEGWEVILTFRAHTLLPIIRDIESFINDNLLPRIDGSDNYRFRFDTGTLEAVTDADVLKAEMARADYLAGLITLNEARAAQGKDADAAGDSYVNGRKAGETIQTNIVASGGNGDEQPMTSAGLPMLGGYESAALVAANLATPEEGRLLAGLPETPMVGELNPLAMPGQEVPPAPPENEQLSPPPLRSWDASKALLELMRWQRFVLSRADNAKASRPFEPMHLAGETGDAIKAELAQASNDSDVLGIMASWADVLSVKAVDDLYPGFSSEFGVYLIDLYSGDVPRQQTARRVVFDIVKAWGERAYMLGRETGGVLSDLDADEKDEMNQLAKDQRVFIRQLVDAIAKERLSEEQILGKVRLWFNGAVKPSYNAGMLSANKNGMYAWALGATEQHCEDCKRLDNQQHRLKDWKKRNLIPGVGQMTKCGGWQCSCQLVPVRGRERGGF